MICCSCQIGNASSATRAQFKAIDHCMYGATSVVGIRVPTCFLMQLRLPLPLCAHAHSSEMLDGGEDIRGVRFRELREGFR